jgi:outer membrane protein assembly factor BamB
VIWQTNLVSAFGGAQIGWQNAASPLVENGLVFVNANTPTASLMAFNATNGVLVWRSQNEALTHSTPVLATINGVRQLIWATQSGLVAVAPATGALFWKFPHPFGYSTSIGSSPVVYERDVFISGYYGIGAYAIRIENTNAVQTPVLRWKNNQFQLQNHWSSPVCFSGAAVGTYTPDNASAQLKCINLANGTTNWVANGFGRGSLLMVGTNLVCLTERGSVVLVAATTNAYQELARFEAIPAFNTDTNKCWNGMALSDGQLYVRSTAYAARYDLSVPDVRLDPPERAANKFNLTIRTVTGTPVESNRLAGMEVRASTNLSESPAIWAKVTNALVLSNGIVRVTNVDAAPARRYFIVNEPK